MISSIKIEAFRGVREGQLDGLGSISILVGPNNSGKSTCLEAVAVVGFASDLQSSLRMLLHRGGPPLDSLSHVAFAEGQDGNLRVALQEGPTYDCRLSIGGVRPTNLVEQARAEGLKQRMLPVRATFYSDWHGWSYTVHAYVDQTGKIATPVLENGESIKTFPCRLVDVQASREPGTLENAYSSIADIGQLKVVVHALAKSMKGLADLRILKAEGEYILHAIFEGRPPVPVYLTGDGSKRLVELAAAVMGIPRDGVVLLEEPECYQHPRHLDELASLLIEAGKSGRQCILSTHSIELVDILLEMAAKESLPYPFVHRLRLVDGRLGAVALNREQAMVARNDLLEDLRA